MATYPRSSSYVVGALTRVFSVITCVGILATSAPAADGTHSLIRTATPIARDAADAQPKAEPEAAAPKGNTPDEPAQSAKPAAEGTMTLKRMGDIIARLDPEANQTRPGSWQFNVKSRVVIIVTDAKHNRMRILSPVAQVADLPDGILQRLMQANFDTALDARYAIARGVVWATYIHPLAALHDRQFISAIGQTVNLVETFGTTFSSGAMSFGAGDSGDIIRRKLIEELMKKGLPI